MAVIGTAIIVPLGIYAYISVKLLTQISVKVFGFKIKSAGAGFIDIVLTLEVSNPANVSVDIEGYNMAVKLNGAPVADVKNTTPRELKAGTSSLLDIPITIKYLEFVSKAKFNELLTYILTAKTDKIVVTLEGDILASVAKVPVATSIKATLTAKDIIEKKDPNLEIGKIKFFK